LCWNLEQAIKNVAVSDNTVLCHIDELAENMYQFCNK
jgi:hypothetical protein